MDETTTNEGQEIRLMAKARNLSTLLAADGQVEDAINVIN